MDDISTVSGNQSAVTTRQLKRLGRGLRPSTVKSLQNNCEDPSSTEWPVYHCRIAHHRLTARVNHNNRNRKAAQISKRWVIDSEDGAALARSKIWLPSDDCRQKPRLERQEAFRVPDMIYISDVVENDADLYRLGLLYHDEQARGSGFNLNDIVRSELVYSVRQAKRTRKALSSSPKVDECIENNPGTQIEAAPPYPPHVSTPDQRSDGVTNDASKLLAVAANIWPQDDQSCADMNSECSEDCLHDWALVPMLRRADSDQSTLVDELDEDAMVASGPWVVLGET